MTDRRKCGAAGLRVFHLVVKVSTRSSTPSPVKEIKFEKLGQAQEQSNQCTSHVTPIVHHPALRYPFSGEGLNSIPSPVKPVQAKQSKHIADDDEDEWEAKHLQMTNLVGGAPLYLPVSSF
jgi:hypothetical protein